MTKSYKAIFFDMDGTIRLTEPSATDAFINLARAYDIIISPEDERRIKIWAHHYWGHLELVQQDMARMSSEEFWLHYSKLLLQTANVTAENEERATAVRDWFGTEYQPNVTVAPGTYETLSALRAAGYHVALVSNRSQPLNEHVSELGLEGMFDLTLAAGEVGYWKPHPQIFHHALSYFSGLQAAECVYVGDNYYADGYGAEQAGLSPIIYDPENLYEKSSFPRIRHLPELLGWLTAVSP